MLKIIVHGCLGKLGQTICKSAKSVNIEIAAGIDGNLDALQNAPYPMFAKIKDCDIPADVIVDCSSVAGVAMVVEYALDKKIPRVVCTTGITPDINEIIQEASTKVAILKSANMSLGINLLINLIQKASKVLSDSGFDIEIIEKHHNLKKDAPSGTALMLADALNESQDNQFVYCYDRSQRTEPREKKEIGIQSLRGGTIIGEHSVIFAGHDEVIELTHQAQSKELFAFGALKAANFLAGKPAGLYDMQDLMNEIQ